MSCSLLALLSVQNIRAAIYYELILSFLLIVEIHFVLS